MVTTEATKKNGCCNGNSQHIQTARTYTPTVDIIENENEVVLVADVPGASQDNIDIQFERGTLTIQAGVNARQDEASTNYLHREYGVGNYQRSFEVNEQIDATKITAQVKNGVLTVHLPKAEAVKPRKIQVNA